MQKPKKSTKLLWANRQLGAQSIKVKEWTPPLEWPFTKKPTQQITKAIVIHNGHTPLNPEQVEVYGKTQALKCFKEFQYEDLTVLEIVKLTKLDGWVVIVQNKV